MSQMSRGMYDRKINVLKQGIANNEEEAAKILLSCHRLCHEITMAGGMPMAFKAHALQLFDRINAIQTDDGNG